MILKKILVKNNLNTRNFIENKCCYITGFKSQETYISHTSTAREESWRSLQRNKNAGCCTHSE